MSSAFQDELSYLRDAGPSVCAPEFPGLPVIWLKQATILMLSGFWKDSHF